MKVLQGTKSKQASLRMHSDQDSLVVPLYTAFFDDDWFKQQTTERNASKKDQRKKKKKNPTPILLIFNHTHTETPPSCPPFSFPPAYQVHP